MSEASTPLGAEAAQLYGLFDKLGHGGKDFSAIIHLLRGQRAGKEELRWLTKRSSSRRGAASCSSRSTGRRRSMPSIGS